MYKISRTAKHCSSKRRSSLWNNNAFSPNPSSPMQNKVLANCNTRGRNGAACGRCSRTRLMARIHRLSIQIKKVFCLTTLLFEVDLRKKGLHYKISKKIIFNPKASFFSDWFPKRLKICMASDIIGLSEIFRLKKVSHPFITPMVKWSIFEAYWKV